MRNAKAYAAVALKARLTPHAARSAEPQYSEKTGLAIASNM